MKNYPARFQKGKTKMDIPDSDLRRISDLREKHFGDCWSLFGAIRYALTQDAERHDKIAIQNRVPTENRPPYGNIVFQWKCNISTIEGKMSSTLSNSRGGVIHVMQHEGDPTVRIALVSLVENGELKMLQDIREKLAEEAERMRVPSNIERTLNAHAWYDLPGTEYMHVV